MRDLYVSFRDELIVDPTKDNAVYAEAASADAPAEVPEALDPLSDSADAPWHSFFKDHDLAHEIDKDAKRTFPALHFFNHEVSSGKY